MKHTTQKRTGFETNSSSSHSLTLGNKNTTEDLSPYKNTEIISLGGSYGWGPDVLDEFKTKLDYICQASRFNPCLFEIARDLVKTRLNSELVFTDDEDENYIDHESVNILNCDEEELEKLLFMSDSYIYVLNDNTNYFTKDGEIVYLDDNDTYKYRKLKQNESAYGRLQLVSVQRGVLFEMEFKIRSDIQIFIDNFKETDFYEFINSNLQYYAS